MEQKYPYMMKPSPTHNFYHVVSLNQKNNKTNKKMNNEKRKEKTKQTEREARL